MHTSWQASPPGAVTRHACTRWHMVKSHFAAACLGHVQSWWALAGSVVGQLSVALGVPGAVTCILGCAAAPALPCSVPRYTSEYPHHPSCSPPRTRRMEVYVFFPGAPHVQGAESVPFCCVAFLPFPHDLPRHTHHPQPRPPTDSPHTPLPPHSANSMLPLTHPHPSHHPSSLPAHLHTFTP